MEINYFKTRFALEDVVYFMYQNEISKGVITRIKVEFEEDVYIHGSYIKQVIRKIKNFFSDHKTDVNVYYSIMKVKNDDTFYCTIAGAFREWELASSKEELFKMLSGDMK